MKNTVDVFLATILLGIRFATGFMLILTAFQFVGAAICSWILWITAESFPDMDLIFWNIIGGLLFLCIFPTKTALLLQNIGQKHTPHATVSIILSLEVVFGALF